MKYYQTLIIGMNKWAVGKDFAGAMKNYHKLHGAPEYKSDLNHVLVFEAQSEFKDSGPFVCLNEVGDIERRDCILKNRFDREDDSLIGFGIKVMEACK